MEQQPSILVVDDSASIRDMVSFTLNSAGFDYHVAEDGVEALEFAKHNSVNVVVTDVNDYRLGLAGAMGSLAA